MKTNQALMDEIDKDTMEQVPEDKLQYLRDRIAQVRELDGRIVDVENQLSELKKERQDLIFDKLPTLFMQVGLSQLKIVAQGNLPAYDAKLEDHFHANIQSGWTEDRKQAALAWVNKHHMGDIIKTTLTMEFGLGQNKIVKKVLAALKKIKITPLREDTIPWQTLTAMVKERHKAGRPLSDVDLRTIGAKVSKIVKLTPIREK